MNLGTYLEGEIVVIVPGLNSNVWFCVLKIGSIFEKGSLWTPRLRTRKQFFDNFVRKLTF